MPSSQPALGAPLVNIDPTPGHYGDWTKVMELIVTDFTKGDRCVRTFTTLDGIEIGRVTDCPFPGFVENAKT